MSNKTDLGSRTGDNFKAFGYYLQDHFIQLVVVAVSATQTYFLVSQIAPRWASWLPILGVCLMEGGYIFWMWREFEADIADGSLADVEKNEQEKIANSMVYITLGLSVLTMLAGGLLEITKSDLASYLQVPVLANWAALLAISGIFVLAGVHLFYDWRYRRADPDVALNREHRAKMRKIGRERLLAELEGEEKVTAEEVKHSRALIDQNKQRIGETRANTNFARSYSSESANTVANTPVSKDDRNNGHRPNS